MRKGLILAGGLGTRLYPTTIGISKHLFPIYDKPMIYYPLTSLMLAGIREIAVIGDNYNLNRYNKLLGDGSSFGVSLTYLLQKKPRGISEALTIGKNFLNGSPSVLILGDNIFYGSGFVKILENVNNDSEFCSIFLYKVKDPSNFGIAEVDSDKNIMNMSEKPSNSSSNLAITGLYFFCKDAPKFCESLTKSSRNEFEIIELLKIYHNKNLLKYKLLGRGFIWFDAGISSSLLKASNFIESIQNRQGSLVGSPEEVAYNKGWLPKEKIIENLWNFKKSSYVKNLLDLLSEN
jgi:glucose-1-phosphate thymidylyltransferase